MTDEMPDVIWVAYPEADENGVEERSWVHSPDLIRLNMDNDMPGAKYRRVTPPEVDLEQLRKELKAHKFGPQSRYGLIFEAAAAYLRERE